MFLLFVYLSVLAVLALGPQVVLGSFNVKLSQVVQCEPVTLTFSGSDANNHSVPTTLTILPLLDNAQPINIAIPNGATNSTGIDLTFIPLPANTQFIASLDDLQGPSASASDVTLVSASNDTATADSGCLGNISATFYQFDDVLNQCESFSVNYTTNSAPNITAFNPRGGSTSVAPLNASEGVAFYPGFNHLQREDEVVLLFVDSEGHSQTTKLIAVGGDSTSNTTCLQTNKKSGSSNSSSHKKSSGGLPQAAIIGIAVGAGVAGLLAVLVLLFFLRFRRRNRQAAKDMEFDPTLLNRRWPPDEKKVASYTPPPTGPVPVLLGDGFVRDPIYTNEKYAASIMSEARTSISSWNQFVPEDQRSQRTKSWTSFAENQGVEFPQRPISRISTTSMNTADVQTILQMATGHRSSRANPDEEPMTPQPATFDIAKPAVARLVSLRRKRADEGDVPVSRKDSAAFVDDGPYGASASYVDFDDDPTAEFPEPTFRHATNPRDTGDWGKAM